MMIEIGVLIGMLFLCFLGVMYKKRRMYQTTCAQFSRWQWWVQVEDMDTPPVLSGKVVKHNKDFCLFIVGVLHKNALSTETLTAINSTYDIIPDLIPCRCIAEPVKVMYSSLTDSALRQSIETVAQPPEGACLRVVIHSPVDVYIINEGDADNFDKAWVDPTLYSTQ